MESITQLAFDGTKACTKCGATKPLSEFYIKGTRHRAACKDCTNAAARQRHGERTGFRARPARKFVTFICKQCSKEHTKPQNECNRFCSHSCAAKWSNSNRAKGSTRPRKRYPRKYKTCSCGNRMHEESIMCRSCRMMQLWPPAAVESLRLHYPQKGARFVAEALGLSPAQVSNKAQRLGIATEVDEWEARARWMRERCSGLELKLHEILRGMDIAFEYSVPIKSKLVVDVRIGALIIQADGDYWHGHKRLEPLTDRQQQQQARDRAQDAYLRACGYSVARIWESDMSIGAVTKVLAEHGLISTSA